MTTPGFLPSAAVLLAAAVIAVPLFRRCGLGSVLAYLVAGMAIGPSGLALVADVEEVRDFAEFGVVLLLFVIGLELLPARLWQMRRKVFGLGTAQVAASALLLGLAAWGLGVPPEVAALAGFGLAMSSTAAALQALSERGQLAAPAGRDAFAVLLFQDLAVLPALALIPAAGGAASLSAGGALAGLAAVAVTVAAGRYALRPYFRALAGAASHEVFIAGALLVVVAVALGMAALGLSMALGAFIAGMLLADSEYRHELEADIEPFKGLLMGLFFMAVGMGISLHSLAEAPLTIPGLALGLVLAKAAVLYGLARRAGHEERPAREIAIGLSQGGEFAFVLFLAAAGSGIMPGPLAERLTIVVALSMMLTPLAYLAADRLLPARRRAAAPEGTSLPDEANQVIIAGFGRFGQIVARVLAVKGISFTALDKDPSQIEFVGRFGNKIYFGDASRPDLLRAAGADQALVLVLAIDDVEASLKTVEMVRQNFPQLRIFARARNRFHAYRLLALGIDKVCRETFLSSLEMARGVLADLGLPESAADEAVAIFREHDEAQLRRSAQHHDDLEKLIEIARQGRMELQQLFDKDRR
ncbi:MAG TPA: monovalent cation:proton antiporter-2 (CPA2) family protein [Burkholderiales bacterium]|nr:monovalent cation:proton antiporter-2 (CPA2) family protein [Burkholderiales bacterium]